jgi:hypothetical protein
MMSNNQKLSLSKKNTIIISKNKYLFFLLLVLGFASLQAQTTVNTTGGDGSGNGGSVSFSVGQPMYQTHNGTNGSAAEGVQQPFEISVLSVLEGVTGINLLLQAYPNPTTNFITLDIVDYEISNLTYQLYDIQGKIIQNQQIISPKTNIEMSNLVSSTYIIRVMQKNRELKSFKIIKN